jgi:magnesium-protoporphyrin IX monomethyl ester (oxidative) cyclase
MRLAYYFDFDHMDGREPDSYIGSAGAEVHKWWACRTNQAETPPVLDAFENASGEFTIHDTRPCRVAAEHELKGLPGVLYALCDTAHALPALVRTTGRPAAELEPVLQDLLQRKLMLEIDGQYLSLAVMRCRVQKPIARNNHDWIQIAAAQTAEPLPSAV